MYKAYRYLKFGNFSGICLNSIPPKCLVIFQARMKSHIISTLGLAITLIVIHRKHIFKRDEILKKDVFIICNWYIKAYRYESKPQLAYITPTNRGHCHNNNSKLLYFCNQCLVKLHCRGEIYKIWSMISTSAIMLYSSYNRPHYSLSFTDT